MDLSPATRDCVQHCVLDSSTLEAPVQRFQLRSGGHKQEIVVKGKTLSSRDFLVDEGR